MPEVSHLSDDAISQIRRTVIAELQRYKVLSGILGPDYRTTQYVNYVGKASTNGIGAVSGSTGANPVPGAGTVTIWQLTTANVLAATTYTLDVYNMAGSVAASALVQIKQDVYGSFWVDVENCSST